MKERTYEIEVVFSTSIYVSVDAEDIDEAMETAEYLASKKFANKIDGGMLKASDFYCEAQTP